MSLDDLFDDSSDVSEEESSEDSSEDEKWKALYLEMEAKYKSEACICQKKKVIGGFRTKNTIQHV